MRPSVKTFDGRVFDFIQHTPRVREDALSPVDYYAASNIRGSTSQKGSKAEATQSPDLGYP